MLDLLDALITQWIAWIWLFNFKVWYVSERRYSTADDLFCRFRNKLINEKEKDEADINNFIDV